MRGRDQGGTTAATTGALYNTGIAEGESTLNFPIDFPIACMGIVTSVRDVDGRVMQEIVATGDTTKSNVTIYVQSRYANKTMYARWVTFGR